MGRSSPPRLGARCTAATKLTDEQARRLEAVAASTGRSRSTVLRDALEAHLDALDALADHDAVTA